MNARNGERRTTSWRTAFMLSERRSGFDRRQHAVGLKS